MRNLFFLLAIIILATLGLNWPIFLNFFYCKPDLLLIFMVALVFYTDFKTALIFGVLAGLAKDIFLPGTVPINTICFGIESYAINRLSRQISTEEDFLRWAIVLVVALLNNFIIPNPPLILRSPIHQPCHLYLSQRLIRFLFVPTATLAH